MKKNKKDTTPKQNDIAPEENFEELLGIPKLRVQQSIYEAGEQMKKESETDKDELNEWDLADLRREDCKETGDMEGRKFWIKVRDYLMEAEFSWGIDCEGIEVIGDDEEPY